MSMGYQVAFGGYSLFTLNEDKVGIASTEVINESPNTYYEPGFNIMFPIEFSSPKADSIFLLFRRRDFTDEYGLEFFEFPQSTFNYDTTVKDATTGESIRFITYLSNRSVWNNTENLTEPIVLEISLFDDSNNIQYRPRVLDITYTDLRTNGFLKFRINISDDNQAFAFIQVNKEQFDIRNNASTFANQAVVSLSDKGNYLIIMPFTSFSESTKEASVFSYPLDTIYYSTEETINAERREYTLGDSNNSIIENHVEISTIPQYPFAGLVRIDGKLRTTLGNVGETIYFDVNASSEISENIDTFRVILERASSIHYL